MRYAVSEVSGIARRLFKDDQVYDDRDITRLARKEGLYVTRPNGSQRIRGSGRLLVMSGDRVVAKFVKYRREVKPVVTPTPVALIGGRLI